MNRCWRNCTAGSNGLAETSSILQAKHVEVFGWEQSWGTELQCLVGHWRKIFVLFYFYSKGSFKMQFVEKYDRESAGQGILPIIPCQISYHKNTVKPVLSPAVPYKCCATSSGQVWSLMDEWIPNSHVAIRALRVCIQSFVLVYKSGITICVKTNQIWNLLS